MDREKITHGEMHGIEWFIVVNERWNEYDGFIRIDEINTELRNKYKIYLSHVYKGYPYLLWNKSIEDLKHTIFSVILDIVASYAIGSTRFSQAEKEFGEIVL